MHSILVQISISSGHGWCFNKKQSINRLLPCPGEEVVDDSSTAEREDRTTVPEGGGWPGRPAPTKTDPLYIKILIKVQLHVTLTPLHSQFHCLHVGRG